jgi:predicted NUDIX family NTP pyrophosphohydrolase
MPAKSAGLIMYKTSRGKIEVLLVHPGGPFWAKKDAGAWSLPKGEIRENEEALAAAQREFEEETGFKPVEPFVDLGVVRHKSGKIVAAWAFRGDCDPALLVSNTFEMEWPPRSGQRREFPEVDRAEFFTLEQAREKLHLAECEFLGRLEAFLHGQSQTGGAAERQAAE